MFQFILFLSCLALGIASIINSFLVYERKPEACIQDWLRLKYGLIPFFIVNWLLLFAFGIVIGVFSGGFALLWYIPLFTFLTWLYMFPGAFYGIQALRLLRKQSDMSMIVLVLHGICQFTFFLDVLDTMYLSVRKFHRGKKAAAVVGSIYVLGFLMGAWVIFFMHA